MTRVRRRALTQGWGTVLAAVMLAVTLGGCAVSVADFPLPAAGVGGDSYRLTAVFADALNLPDGAHVKVNGDDVGRVRTITTSDFTAHVEMAVRKDLVLPAGTTAELCQDTPLGEVFVALHPSASAPPGAPALRDGDEIGLADTATAIPRSHATPTWWWPRCPPPASSTSTSGRVPTAVRSWPTARSWTSAIPGSRCRSPR